MAARPIARARRLHGHAVLYNPQSVPMALVEELQGRFGLQPKAAGGCLADVMVPQRQGEFPPVAFMLINPGNRHLAVATLVDNLEKAQRAFKHAYVIVIERYLKLVELQAQHLQRLLTIQIMQASSNASAASLMMTVYERHSFQNEANAQTILPRVESSLLSRAHSVEMLRANFQFLTPDEGDMLLGLYGNISSLAQASAEDILDTTVLNADAAHAISEFFQTEYVVE